MSNTTQSPQTFETKMQNISEYLKERVLDPAEQEKKNILAEAREESSRILEEARKEAGKIVAEAREHAEREKNSLHSALRIASKQAIDTLKLALEKSVLKQLVAEPVSGVISSEEVVKSFIAEVIKTTAGQSAEIMISDDLKNKISDYVKNEIIAKSSSKIALSAENVPSGFAVVLSDKQLMLDFTEESLIELLSGFVRSELREYLFEK
ncbi:MAG: hypothetical protein JXK07_10590 [Spirochaetes bacterium]|nr:hypothetical protein [Spirochaetota bacterium]MBN2769287.1 hypothetical protein [Spirochaetota bacterium]